MWSKSKTIVVPLYIMHWKQDIPNYLSFQLNYLVSDYLANKVVKELDYFFKE